MRVCHKVGATTKILGLRILSGHHAYALLLRMGNYFVRTTLSVGVVMHEQGRFRVVRRSPSQRDLDLWQTILKFFVVSKREGEEELLRAKPKKRSSVCAP